MAVVWFFIMCPVIACGLYIYGMHWLVKRQKRKGPAVVLQFRVPTKDELATLEDFHRTIDDIEKGTQRILREKGLIE